MKIFMCVTIKNILSILNSSITERMQVKCALVNTFAQRTVWYSGKRITLYKWFKYFCKKRILKSYIKIFQILLNIIKIYISNYTWKNLI